MSTEALDSDATSQVRDNVTLTEEIVHDARTHELAAAETQRTTAASHEWTTNAKIWSDDNANRSTTKEDFGRLQDNDISSAASACFSILDQLIDLI